MFNGSMLLFQRSGMGSNPIHLSILSDVRIMVVRWLAKSQARVRVSLTSLQVSRKVGTDSPQESEVKVRIVCAG